MSRVPGDVLLVGSLPYTTAEESLRNAAALGSDVNALPDGEVGERRKWTGFLPIRTFSQHPDLVETRTPTKEMPEGDGLPGAAPEYHWTFQIRPGVASLTFDDLGYAEAALESYAMFTALRDEAKVAPGVRFQMSLPATASAIHQWFDDPEQWPEIRAAYVRVIAAEIDRVLEVVPAEDLAIQFDMAWEVNDLSIGDETYYDFWPEMTYDEKFRLYADLVVELTGLVPEDVVLGFHWCYGTWGGWPMTEMADVRLCVDLSNATVPRCPRRIDYVHIPVIDDPDAAFFAPLRDLDIGDTKVFLGLVHHGDGIEGAKRRIELAQQSLPSFGVAAVCGYGRENPAELDGILELNRAAAHAGRRLASG